MGALIVVREEISWGLVFIVQGKQIEDVKVQAPNSLQKMNNGWNSWNWLKIVLNWPNQH